MGFLDDFLGRDGGYVDPDELHKNAVHNDRWDEEDKDSLLEEMKEFSAAEDRLTDFVDTGAHAYSDMFYALVKADPRLYEQREVMPSFQINRVVADEAQALKEYEEMRAYTTGDHVAAGLATVAMEPELENIFDKLKQEQKLAEQLQEQMQQMQGLQQEEADIDGMMQQLESGELEDPEGTEAQNFQERKDLIQAAKEQLEKEMEETAGELEESLDKAASGVRTQLKHALAKARDEAAELEDNSQAWGLDPGTFHRLPAKERIEMARRFQNERFRRIAQLFGPMHRMAFAEQMRKTDYSRDEIHDIETGADLARLLPMELLYLRNPALKLDFYRRFYEGSLLQYKMQGQEKLARGGIVFCEDGSGSMSGDPEIWAKAVGLTLLQLARAQRRSFYGIHFGGPGTTKQFDFRDTTRIKPEDVLTFAETFFGGGTDFMTPLSQALDILREEFDSEGAVKADIVFATDGMCGVDDKRLEDFKKEQERMSFRVFGIIIGGHPDSEPLNTIADGRVMTVQQLHSGDDLREIFRNI